MIILYNTSFYNLQLYPSVDNRAWGSGYGGMVVYIVMVFDLTIIDTNVLGYRCAILETSRYCLKHRLISTIRPAIYSFFYMSLSPSISPFLHFSISPSLLTFLTPLQAITKS